MANIISHTSCPVSTTYSLQKRHIVDTLHLESLVENLFILNSSYWSQLEFLGYECTSFYYGKAPQKSQLMKYFTPQELDSWYYSITCYINRKKYDKKKLLTSSVLTISFAMKRRIFSGTDGFPNLPCRNFIQRGRSTGTVPWNLKEESKNQFTSWSKQAYQGRKTSARAIRVCLKYSHEN